MTREIRFRVWCNNKIEPVGTIDWADRLPITCNTKTRKLYQDDDHFVLMQFTGKYDRKHMEIFEGDIVKILYSDWPSCTGCHETLSAHMNALAETKVVVWSENGFYVSHAIGGFSESMELGEHGNIEVIGNVFETPELLK